MAQYFRPTELDEAIEIIAPGGWAILAGGTDFYPAHVDRPIDDDVLDITAIERLRGIEVGADHWRIGATTTWTDIVRAELTPLFDGLKLAAREIGGWQVQNAGTVAGNLCNASPAADGVPALLSLDAHVELTSVEGTVLMPLADFIVGNRRTARRPEQLMTAIRIPRPTVPAVGDFLKLGTRRYLVISIVMVAGVLECAGDGRVANARVAIGACSEAARRLYELEAELVGRPITAALAEAVSPAHLIGLQPIDDCRGTAEYRRDAALTLTRRLLQRLGARP